MRAWIELGPGLDATAWAARHREGLVPDRAPYGLDRLAQHGLEPDFRPGTSGSIASLLDRADRRLLGGQWSAAARARVPRGTDVAISWDERTGAPRGLFRPAGVATATGVVWYGEPDGATGAGAALTLRGLRRSALVWVLSSAQVPVLRELGVPASRLRHLVFGIDDDFFRAAPVHDADPDLLVSVGNDRHRDWPLLLRAFTDLRARRPNARLELVTRHAVPQVPGVVVHESLGHVDLQDLYARAAAVVVSTRHNLHVSGMTTALEAKAVSRPVVMTRTPGAEDYVADGRDGLLVPPAAEERLARALDAVLAAGAEGRAEMGAAGRRSVEEVHSTRHQAHRLAELVREHC